MDKTIKNHHYIIAFFLLLTLSLMAFYPSLNFPFFIFGDGDILQNFSFKSSFFESTHNAMKPGSLWANFIWSYIGQYSSNPFSFRAINLSFHFLNSFLLYIIVFKMISALKYSIPCSLIASSLFILHPLSIQSVVWVSALPTLLTFFFIILSTLFYINSSSKKIDLYLLLSSLFYFLSVMNSKSAFFIPFLYLLFDKILRKASLKTISLKFIFFIPGLIFIYNYWYHFIPANIFTTSYSVIEKSKMLYFLFFKLIAPLNLSIDYPFPQVDIIEILAFAFGVISLILLSLKNRVFTLIPIAIAYFFITQLPFNFYSAKEASNVQLYMSVPLFCFLIVLFQKIYLSFKKENFNLHLSSLILAFLFLGFNYHQRVLKTWETSEKQLLTSYSKYPSSFNLNMALGALYKSKSNNMKALFHFNQAREINPKSVVAKSETIRIYKIFNPTEGDDMAKIDFFFKDLSKSLKN